LLCITDSSPKWRRPMPPGWRGKLSDRITLSVKVFGGATDLSVERRPILIFSIGFNSRTGGFMGLPTRSYRSGLIVCGPICRNCLAGHSTLTGEFTVRSIKTAQSGLKASYGGTFVALKIACPRISTTSVFKIQEGNRSFLFSYCRPCMKRFL